MWNFLGLVVYPWMREMEERGFRERERGGRVGLMMMMRVVIKVLWLSFLTILWSSIFILILTLVVIWG